jgi:hypothetical protein
VAVELLIRRQQHREGRPIGVQVTPAGGGTQALDDLAAFGEEVGLVLPPLGVR